MRLATPARRISSLFLLLVLQTLYAFAQTPAKEWVWVGGSNGGAKPQTGPVSGQGSSFGGPSGPPTPGIAGGRSGAAGWTDSSGNFWMFGGNALDATGLLGFLNDLWKYNPSTQGWTWFGGSQGGQPGVYGTKGTPYYSNIPGGRYNSQTWTDASGNLWLFGGIGYDSNNKFGALDDLWELNPSTQQWTWIAGSNLLNPATVTGTIGTPAAANTPGGRSQAFIWTDLSGNTWLFGGVGVSSNPDDVWELDATTHEWTCERIGSGQGNYSSGLGVPSKSAFPGSRTVGTSWTDSSGSLWLFGGIGVDGVGASGGLNDLWEFNPATLQWTWQGGSSAANQPGVTGDLGVPAAQNIPAGRGGQLSWVDKSNNVWLLGGQAFYISNGPKPYELNDLWQLDTATLHWTWMGGSTTPPGYFDQNVSYGSLGSPDPTNFPAGRFSGNAWTGGDGILWLFGGLTGQSNGTDYYANDVWAFGVPTPAPTFSLSPGTYSGPQTLAINDSNAQAQIFYTNNGQPVPDLCECVTGMPYTQSIPLAAGATISAVAVAPGFINSKSTTGVYYIPQSLSMSVFPTSVLTPVRINSTESLQVTIDLNVPPFFVAPFPPLQSSYGTMTLSSGSYNSGPFPVTNLNGVSFTIPAGSLAVGNDTLTATFVPNAITSRYYNGATASLPVTIVPAIPTITTLSATANPQNAGGLVILIAKVTTASGTIITNPVNTYTYAVSFYIDGSLVPQLGVTLDATGRAFYPIATFTPGTHTITASFMNAGSYGGSSSTLTETISSTPASIASVSGSGVSTPYGLEFGQPLVAVVKDAQGHLVPGAAVTFSGAGLRFSTATAITNSNGQASVRAYATASGSLTAFASVAGVGTAATFGLTATRAMLLVKSNKTTFSFGEPIPPPTYSLVGFTNGDTAVTAVTGQAAIYSPARLGSPPGIYPIGLARGTLSAQNYNLVFEQGTVTITP